MANIGAGGFSTVISVTPTLTVHATYASGDFVGTNNTAMTFTDAARSLAGTGWIMGAELIDYSATVGVAAELWLFDTTPAGLGNDSAAFTITDAASKQLICVIPFTTYFASALNCVSQGIPAGPAAFKCLTGSKDIYGCLVTRGAPAYASGDVTVRLFVMQD